MPMSWSPALRPPRRPATLPAARSRPITPMPSTPRMRLLGFLGRQPNAVVVEVQQVVRRILHDATVGPCSRGRA